MVNQAKNVVEFYVLCNKLKNVIRTGWMDWHVSKDRLESVAEHIYGVQMLAIAMWSEYKYEIDIKKVILMLAVHELEEIKIGDLTQFQISKEEKKIIGHQAVKEVLSHITEAKYIEDIILEYDARETKESKFASLCDKLECGIQCRLYDEEGLVDVHDVKNKLNFHDNDVLKMLEEGYSWSEMWMTFGQKKYNYDENFLEVGNYAKSNRISK